jgi:phosphoglycerate dehydrogenase-like enzyme
MIGRRVCEMLKQFDLNVLACDPFAGAQDARTLGVQLVSLEELFRQSDVVSLHTPWLKETEGMITGELLRSMKQDASFINTARGAVVREKEMIEVLEQRPDLFAVLDVTYPEPPEKDSPLYTLPNVIITPHIAGALDNECHRMARYMIAEVKRFLNGEPLTWGIDKEKASILA